MQTLNIIGGGKVGKTLGKLWIQQDSLAIGDVVCRTISAAENAVNFIEAGRAIDSISDCSEADLFMLTTPDDVLESITMELLHAGLIKNGTLVFHCSGSISSAVLEPLKALGSMTCSIHPLKSFADPEKSVETFAGTFCALEGESDACEQVSRLFQGIGARIFEVKADQKMLYHGASVFVCNYLTALLETGIRLYEQAGLDRAESMEIMEPIVRGTVSNVFQKGTAEALTGPISRGDHKLVEKQLGAVNEWNESIGELYVSLGRIALELAVKQGHADPSDLKEIDALFSCP